jgi:ABC-2 type transport system ATP-binding protein
MIRPMDAGPAVGEAVPPALRVDQLSVRYGDRVAVRELSLEVRPGELYGLLGSNGAGKTSTIKSVVGLVRPNAGQIRVFGHDVTLDPLTTKQTIGYVPESPLLFDALTPQEFLEFIASVRQLPSDVASARARSYGQAFQIEAEFDRPISTLSNGVRQKVLLVAALLHQPRLLVLDEPFNNLDPRAVRVLKDLVVRYAHQDGRAVLLSTHTMELAEQLCDRVGILDQGLLRGEGSLLELKRAVSGDHSTLESIFLRLTSEEEGVREAARLLGGP